MLFYKLGFSLHSDLHCKSHIKKEQLFISKEYVPVLSNLYCITSRLDHCDALFTGFLKQLIYNSSINLEQKFF